MTGVRIPVVCVDPELKWFPHIVGLWDRALHDPQLIIAVPLHHRFDSSLATSPLWVGRRARKHPPVKANRGEKVGEIGSTRLDEECTIIHQRKEEDAQYPWTQGRQVRYMACTCLRLYTCTIPRSRSPQPPAFSGVSTSSPPQQSEDDDHCMQACNSTCSGRAVLAEVGSACGCAVACNGATHGPVGALVACWHHSRCIGRMQAESRRTKPNRCPWLSSRWQAASQSACICLQPGSVRPRPGDTPHQSKQGSQGCTNTTAAC